MWTVGIAVRKNWEIKNGRGIDKGSVGEDGRNGFAKK